MSVDSGVAVASSATSSIEQAVIGTAEIFGLLADPGRLRLLAVLHGGEASVGVLAKSAGLSESAASHALRLLRAHRVVQAQRDGRLVRYRLTDERVRRLLEFGLFDIEPSARRGADTVEAASDEPAQQKRSGKRQSKRGKGKRAK